MNTSSKRLASIKNIEPKLDDPAEIRIVNLVKKEFLSTKWSSEKFEEIKNLLSHFFKESYAKINQQEQDQVFADIQALFSTINKAWNSKIVEGENLLEKLPKDKPVFIISNHLGVAKLVNFTPSELGHGFSQIPTDVISAFPAHYAALYPIAKYVNKTLIQAAFELYPPVSDIQKAVGSILFAPSENLSVLQWSAKKVLEKYPTSAVAVFPEGRTSGKPNNSGIYDLGTFKTGGYVIAGELGIPIVEAYQYFNPKTGFEIGITRTIYPVKNFTEKSEESIKYYKNLAFEGQNLLQKALNKKRLIPKQPAHYKP